MVPTKAFDPSPYQQAIFDHVSDPTKGNLIVEAVAGSGKTTTITHATKFVPPENSILFAAFGKKNVEDLKPKMPKNATASTLNSVGSNVWSGFLGRWVPVNDQKTYQLLDEFFPRKELTHSVQQSLIEGYRRRVSDDAKLVRKYERSLNGKLKNALNDFKRLISMAKGAGLVPDMVRAKRPLRSLMQDTRDNWLLFIDSQDLDIERPDIAIEVGRRVLARSIETAGTEIDYDDQLYMPIIAGAGFPQYDWVFVDEAQDLNAIQHAIVKEVVKEDGRIVAVGDRYQAIYAWRGSLSNSMDILRAELKAEELPLSICYRCGKKIVELAQTVVPHIKPHEQKGDGEIITVQSYNHKLFGPKDAVICRNVRPLVDLAYKLISAGVACRILNRDIEHGLVKLIKKMEAGSIHALLSKLSDYEATETAKLKAKRQNERAQGLSDRVETIRSLSARLSERMRTVDGLVETINRIFKMDKLREKEMLMLSTIHAAKGMEWDNVFILDRSRMPSKYATSPEALQQEKNIEYVAYTRAIKRLYFIESAFFEEEGVKCVA